MTHMEAYLKQIVDDYEELATELTGRPVKLKEVATPFLDEDCSRADARAPLHNGDPLIDCPHCRHSFSPIADSKTKEDLLKFLTAREVHKGDNQSAKPDLQDTRTGEGNSNSTKAQSEGSESGATREECAPMAETTAAAKPKFEVKAKTIPGEIVMPAKKFTKAFKKIRDKAAKSKQKSNTYTKRANHMLKNPGAYFP